MIKPVFTLLLFLLSDAVFAQESKLEVEFDHEWGVEKYLLKNKLWRGTRKLAERPPYVHSLTIDLEIGLNGKIIGSELLEKTAEEDINTFWLNLALDTDSLWKPVNVPEGSNTVHVIIPIIFRTPPYKSSDDRPGLIEKFRDDHTRLNKEIDQLHPKGNYIVIPEIFTFTGARPRGIK